MKQTLKAMNDAKLKLVIDQNKLSNQYIEDKESYKAKFKKLEIDI